jgi:uncharacterized repeat protein (TIGR01451 family)
MVRAMGKGAIASWSPTGLGVATGHDYLNRGLYEAIFQDYVAELGLATTQAKMYLYSNTGAFRELIETYALLGDPATHLQILRPEVGIRKTVQQEFDQLYPGNWVTYTLTFSNSGLRPAAQVVLEDQLPAGLINSSVTSSGVVITPRSGDLYIWDVANIAVGAGGIVTITAQIAPDFHSKIINTVTISALGDLPESTNNIAQTITLVVKDYWLPLILNTR